MSKQAVSDFVPALAILLSPNRSSIRNQILNPGLGIDSIMVSCQSVIGIHVLKTS